MKNILTILTIIVLAATACSTDKNEKLKDLKAERDKVNAQITSLEKELKADGSLEKHENKTYVKLRELKPVTFRHYVEVKGNVESDNNVFVPSEMPGIVERVIVKEGEKVKKGQLLAKIDDDQIQSQIKPLKTQLDLATTVYERQKRLWEREIGSEIQYLQAKTNKEALEQQIESIYEQLEMTKMTSPITGMVDQIMMKEGEMAAAGKSGIRVVGTGDMKIKANVSDSYYGQIKKGDTAKVKIPSAGTNFERPIFAVAKAIDAGSRTFGIDIRPPKNLDISPNMLAIVTVNDYTSRNAITVPVNLVQTDEKGKFLFVAKHKDGKTIAVRRNVVTKKSYKGKSEVLDGLSAGDKIIVSGYQDVANGQEITVQQ